ncbi:nucleotidyltransferase domain-containing protein [bacterium]|nr:nucleotidyltransferase domain-containing protein [bacterium]
MERSEIAKRVREFFDSSSNVQLVLLFGSSAMGTSGPESDVDIAVLFERVPGAYESQDLKEGLAEKLNREVDLIILNHASPILRMQVLKKGIPVLVKEQQHYCRFFTDTISQYDDLKRVRRASEENILKGRIYA